MSLINTIKALFESAVPTAASFKDVKSSDGVILRIDGDLIEGAKASVIAEDGSISPAPAQDYTLEDGSVISIAEDGTIAKIIADEVDAAEVDAAEVVAPTEVPVESPVESPEEEKAEDDAMVALEAKVAELESAIAKIVEQLNSQNAPAEEAMKEIKKENKELKKQNKELAAEPAKAESDFKKVEYTAIDALKKGNKASSTVNEELMSKILALKK